MGRKKIPETELLVHASKLPLGKDDWSEEDFKSGHVHLLGTGHKVAVKHFKNLGGRPRVEDKKVLLTLRMTESKLMAFKAKAGRGWQTKLRNYVEQAISTGLSSQYIIPIPIPKKPPMSLPRTHTPLIRENTKLDGEGKNFTSAPVIIKGGKGLELKSYSQRTERPALR
jgi:hypothetical protein